MYKWYSVDTPQAQERFSEAWGGIDAPTDELGAMLLEIAKGDVVAYASAQFDDLEPVDIEDDWEDAWDDAWGEDDAEGVPARYVFAQLQQAKNLWNAGRAQSDGEAGSEGYSFVPRPLDKTIRQLIRPKRGIPYVI